MKNNFNNKMLPYLLLRSHYLVVNEFYKLLERSGLPIQYWRVLSTLSSGEVITLGELADLCMRGQSATTQLVDRMIKAGLVEKLPSDEDGRKVLISITKKGQETVAPLLTHAVRVDQSIMAAFEEKKARQLKKLLRELIGRFG